MTTIAQPTIRYALGMPKPSTHLFEVEVRIDNLPSTDSSASLVMPAWRTGRYVIFDFAGGVISFAATNEAGKPLAWSKVDKQTWKIESNGAGHVRAHYQLYANEFNQRTRGLNDEHAFVDPATVFMEVGKYDHLPLTVNVHPYADWHVTTGLEPAKDEANLFTAPNYQYFADCPIEVGTQHDFEFVAEGKPHVLMIAGEGNWDEKKMIPDITKLVSLNKQFWGELPYDRYIFMLHVSPQGGGGTEHINSTIMQTRPFGFKNPDSYRGFLGLVSHEYFHTWNVKQLRPSGIHPYDFSKENYSRELWIAEGTTSYYGGLFMVRAGFTTAEQYLNNLATTVQGDRMRPGNTMQSVTESSFDAWIKYWRNTPQAYNTETDYYDRGSDVSLLLDLEIRRRSQNEHSLDDVMKAMFQRFRLDNTGYTVEDFERVCTEFAGSTMRQFFDDYVRGTKPLPWETVLAHAGLHLTPKEAEKKVWLGLGTFDANGSVRVNRVIAGSPAYDAGLDLNDEVLALNGVRVSSSGLLQRVGEMNAGDVVTLTVFREDKLREFKVTLAYQPVPQYRIEKVEKPTEPQKALYESWLRSTF